MGSEQSNSSHGANSRSIHGRPNANAANNNPTRLQRGNTIAVTDRRISSPHEETAAPITDSRPVSPPMSVCSDSDLPYVSYTDKPIGDSPKLRNKGASSAQNNVRNAAAQNRRNMLGRVRPKSLAHDIVVVHEASRKGGPEQDPDLQRLKSIPQFLPVMRGTVSLPANRDPEVLERLQPNHLRNVCSRMQAHLNACATQVAADQAQLTVKVKEVDFEVAKVFNSFSEKQRLYASHAEQFAKLHHITQQLSRCNVLLNQNLESMEMLNNMLSVEDRLQPFLWKTSDDF